MDHAYRMIHGFISDLRPTSVGSTALQTIVHAQAAQLDE